jgi:hypothetical protein
MTYTRLESSLAKIKKDMKNVKRINRDFFSVLDELNSIKAKANDDPLEKEYITKEFKEREIIDLFSSIEKEYNEIRAQLIKQELYKDKISDFVESLRTRKTYTFEESTKTILFLENAVENLSNDQISMKPEFIGTIDFTEMAIDMSLYKNGNNVLFQKEQLGEVLNYLISKRMFRNIVFETDNAKIILKNSSEIIIESNNNNIRKVSRIEV